MNKSDYSILIAAFVSFLFSITLWFGVLGGDIAYNKQAGIFVGIWVPSILALGSFLKLRAGGGK
jgi:hypothetical protein